MDVCAPYPKFPKIPRLNRTTIITEKIDGTNALVHISDEGVVRAGSRSRWITPEVDNFGFAAWVAAHDEDLFYGLGPGHHYGEWYGAGIQRGYGLTDRRFALFNTGRWNDLNKPACCEVVPVLATIEANISAHVWAVLEDLHVFGSKAVPGFMRPEGVVVFHAAAGQLFKVLLENDATSKGGA